MSVQRGPSRGGRAPTDDDRAGVRVARYPRAHDPIVGAPLRVPDAVADQRATPPVHHDRGRAAPRPQGRDHPRPLRATRRGSDPPSRRGLAHPQHVLRGSDRCLDGTGSHCHPKRARQRRRTAGDRSHDRRCVVAHHEGARSPMEGRRLRDRQRARCDRGGARVVGTPALVRSAALARSAGDGMWARRSAQRRPRSIRRDLGASWMVVLLAGADDARQTMVSATSTTHAAGAVIVSQRNLSRRGAVGSIEAVDAIPGVRAFYAGGAFVSERNRRGVPGIYLGRGRGGGGRHHRGGARGGRGRGSVASIIDVTRTCAARGGNALNPNPSMVSPTVGPASAPSTVA